MTKQHLLTTTLLLLALPGCSLDDVEEGNTTLETPTNSTTTTSTSASRTTVEGGPKLETVGSVKFPRTQISETISSIFFIKNSGDEVLKFKSLVISPASETSFDLSYPQDLMDLENEEKQFAFWPEELAPGDEFPVRVLFTSKEPQESQANLTILSNDPNYPSTTVSLIGNADSPCLNLAGVDKLALQDRAAGDTHTLDFTKARDTEGRTKRITLENCSKEKRVEISEIALFDLPDDPLQNDSFKVGDIGQALPIVLEAGGKKIIEVTYAPDQMIGAKHKGRLKINSNDTLTPQYQITLSGENKACSDAKAFGTVIGGGMPLSDQVLVDVMQGVEFAGAFEDKREVGAYEWSVLSQPAGADIMLTPDRMARSPQASFTTPGTYLFELNLFDRFGQKSCNTPQVRALVGSGGDVEVVVTWETPKDRFPNDMKGTDIDLHWLHENAKGIWKDKNWDVYWEQKTQDWGVRGDPDDDPSLTIDDTDGDGPEKIEHSNLEADKRYSVGVYYYDDDGFGESYVTVKIFVDGNLFYESRRQYLQAEDTFWHVGDLDWSTKTFKTIGKVGPGTEFQGIAQ